MNRKKLKIGFHSMCWPTWPAGKVYLEGLFRVLKETYADDLSLCLVVLDGGGGTPDEIQKLVDQIVVYPQFRRWTALWAIDQGTKRLFEYNLVGDFVLRRQAVRVLALGSSPLRSKIPTLSWLPDFQHIHFPEMFSMEECHARNRGFRRVAERSTRIVLLSDSVRRDFQAFAPRHADKARVVSPVSYVPSSVYERDPTSVSGFYYLPDKFVYLPNQFWKHKNHRVAFRALKILRDKGIEVFLVCSGYPGDQRHPNYFTELLEEVSRLGIRNQVAILGVVPREHVLLLMRQSICVLNPSLFEGYGMSIDEARSLGKQVLVSDIPAHREQDPPRATFFDPKDCEDLSAKLGQIWCDKLPGPDRELEREARHSLPERLRKYGETFLSVVQEVTKV